MIVAVSFLQFACSAAFAVLKPWHVRKKLRFGHGAPKRLSSRLDGMFTVCEAGVSAADSEYVPVVQLACIDHEPKAMIGCSS